MKTTLSRRGRREHMLQQLHRRRGGHPARVGARGGSGGPAGQELLDAPHQGVEGRAGVTVVLAEVSRSEPADETVDANPAHSLVAETQAGVRVAPHDEVPPLDHLAVLIDGENAGPTSGSSPQKDILTYPYLSYNIPNCKIFVGYYRILYLDKVGYNRISLGPNC